MHSFFDSLHSLSHFMDISDHFMPELVVGKDADRLAFLGVSMYVSTANTCTHVLYYNIVWTCFGGFQIF